MNEIIPMQPHAIGGATVQTVDARELHGFLEVGKDFSSWIKVQFERARLVEGRDYLLTKKGENPGGGRPRTEYAITIEAAKHIGMMSGTEKGFQVRDYFIECERLAQAPALPDFTDPATAAVAWAEQYRAKSMAEAKVLTLEHQTEAQAVQLAEVAPKVAALERIANADGGVCITIAAKDLQMRPKDLFHWLQANQWIYRRAGGMNWLAYQSRIQQGVLMHKVTTVERSDGTVKTVEQVLVTPKGLVRIAEEINTPQPSRVPRINGSQPGMTL